MDLIIQYCVNLVVDLITNHCNYCTLGVIFKPDRKHKIFWVWVRLLLSQIFSKQSSEPYLCSRFLNMEHNLVLELVNYDLIYLSSRIRMVYLSNSQFTTQHPINVFKCVGQFILELIYLVFKLTVTISFPLNIIHDIIYHF